MWWARCLSERVRRSVCARLLTSGWSRAHALWMRYTREDYPYQYAEHITRLQWQFKRSKWQHKNLFDLSLKFNLTSIPYFAWPQACFQLHITKQNSESRHCDRRAMFNIIQTLLRVLKFLQWSLKGHSRHHDFRKTTLPTFKSQIPLIHRMYFPKTMTTFLNRLRTFQCFARVNLPYHDPNPPKQIHSDAETHLTLKSPSPSYSPTHLNMLGPNEICRLSVSDDDRQI